MRQVTALGLTGCLLFGTGFAVSHVLQQKALTTVDSQAASLDKANGYPLLAKEIFIEKPNDQIINFAPLRKSLNQYYEQNKLDGSLYFEYLPTGTSIRIDGEEEQVAASLLKVPAAMDLYKAAETKKIDLDKTIELRPQWLDSSFGDLYKKGAGYKLTLRQAAKIMLEQSDNTALKAIATTMEEATVNNTDNNVFNSLDVEIVQNIDMSVSVNARAYSSITKCLYFSCYLNHDDSQQILEYLSHTDFDNRLQAGVDDKSIPIAHKIGVRKDETQSDCGIIYLANRNYSLCIMVKGKDNPETNKHIAAMSRLVYDYLKAQ